MLRLSSLFVENLERGVTFVVLFDVDEETDYGIR